jgi:hypothetical protein
MDDEKGRRGVNDRTAAMPVEIQKVISFSIWYSYLGDWEMVVVMLVGGGGGK